MPIHFTDDEWNGTSLTAGEDEATWTNGGSVLPEGSIVTFSELTSATAVVSVGTVVVSAPPMNITNSDEALFAYIGSPGNPTAFLSAITNDDFTAAGATLTNTGLVVGTSAMELDAIDADSDVAAGTKFEDLPDDWECPVCGADKSDFEKEE